MPAAIVGGKKCRVYLSARDSVEKSRVSAYKESINGDKDGDVVSYVDVPIEV